MKRRGNFEIFYDDCETEVLKLLHNYNMTFASLSREIDVRSDVITDLAYGITSPVYLNTKKKGQIKPTVQKICDYFALDVDEVFPRYLCSINAKQKFNSHELCPWTTYSEKISDEEYVLNYVESQEVLGKLKLYFSTRNYEIFIKHIMFNASYRDLGFEYNITHERVSQIVYRGLRYLNKKFPKVVQKEKRLELAQNLRDEERKLWNEECNRTQSPQIQYSYKLFEVEMENQSLQKTPNYEQSGKDMKEQQQKKSVFSRFINFFKNKSM